MKPQGHQRPNSRRHNYPRGTKVWQNRVELDMTKVDQRYVTVGVAKHPNADHRVWEKWQAHPTHETTPQGERKFGCCYSELVSTKDDVFDFLIDSIEMDFNEDFLCAHEIVGDLLWMVIEYNCCTPSKAVRQLRAAHVFRDPDDPADQQWYWKIMTENDGGWAGQRNNPFPELFLDPPDDLLEIADPLNPTWRSAVAEYKKNK